MIASSAHFPELAEFIEGLHHAADRGRSACLCPDACPDLHAGRRPVCRLLCRPDRPEPAAGRALRAYLSDACAHCDTAKAIDFRHSVPVLEGTAGGPISSLEGKRLCDCTGRFSLPERARPSSSVEKLRQMTVRAARRGFPVIHRPSPHIRVVSSPKSLFR